MPRQQRALKEKQRKTWDTEVVQLAINSVKSNKLSVRKASILFHVPGNTLQRLVDTDLPLKECVNVRGRKPLMPPEIEAQLVDYLLILENRFFGITINDVRMMTYQLAIRNNLKYPFGRKEKVGRAWFNRFIGRHSNLIIHKSSDDTSNFKTGFNKETVSAFFKILGNVYEEQNYNADRIFNVDAIGFNIIQCKIPQIVCLKGKRQIGLLTADDRESLITVICSMSAGGTFIPPMIIFPRKNMIDIVMKGAPAGSIGRCHPSGWVQTHLFTEWFEHFIKNTNPTKESPILLILDGHYAHTRNLDVIDIARKNYVTILSIPPHSTHKMQPLDRTFMTPFKQYYSEYIHIWQCENERPVKQYDIAEILGKAYLQCQTDLIAANGFKLTGIYPFKPYIFSDSDFIASTSAEKNPTDFMSFTRETTTSITKQYHQIEDFHQIEKDLAQPNYSKDGKVEQMTPVSPEETWPDLQIKSRKLTRDHEPLQATIFTNSVCQKILKDTETKKFMKNSIFKKNVKKHRKKGKPKNISKECNSVTSINSELKLRSSEAVLAKEDAICIFCNELFSEDKDEMFQCLICDMWAHVACSGPKKDKYICDFCK
ncbi:uncharacterized protein LOC105194808 isoform X3 [Solenopsis invicta]|nr:uncharacterized protein LOC105194808 isoform X3 [Solenopsis invicta]